MLQTSGYAGVQQSRLSRRWFVDGKLPFTWDWGGLFNRNTAIFILFLNFESYFFIYLVNYLSYMHLEEKPACQLLRWPPCACLNPWRIFLLLTPNHEAAPLGKELVPKSHSTTALGLRVGEWSSGACFSTSLCVPCSYRSIGVFCPTCSDLFCCLHVPAAV